MPAPSLFDAYIMVDWSAASKPVTGANSIWIAVLWRRPDGDAKLECLNLATRSQAQDEIQRRVAAFNSGGQRVVLGFDFALGYPAGTAATLGLDQNVPPWRAMHTFLETHILDADDNTNNRFALAATMNQALSGKAHPFWGAPKAQTCATLSARKGAFSPGHGLAEYRAAEAWIKSHFRANPKSVWQLLGAGSVGSQSLLGIAYVSRLRRILPDCRIWPFETGLSALTQTGDHRPQCVIAEIYPSTLNITATSDEVIDRAQVRSLATQFFERDSAGELSSAFTAPNSLDRRVLEKIEAEEGWILAI